MSVIREAENFSYLFSSDSTAADAPCRGMDDPCCDSQCFNNK